MQKEKIYLFEEDKTIYDLYKEVSKQSLRTQEVIYLGSQLFRTHNAERLQKSYVQTYLRNQGNPLPTKLSEGLLKPISLQEMTKRYKKNVGLGIKICKKSLGLFRFFF